MKLIAVIAGNRREFEYYLFEIMQKSIIAKIHKNMNHYEIDGKKYHYISRIEQLRGCFNFELVFYGTYYKTWRYEDIEYAKEIQRRNERK